MTNAYYNFDDSDELVPGTRGRANEVNEQFRLIAAGFDNIPAVGSAPFGAPTVKVGLEFDEGVANFVLRSDAQLAIDEDIEPDWTGVHNFTAGATFAGVSSSNFAQLSASNTFTGANQTFATTRWRDGSAALNEKMWFVNNTGGLFVIGTLTDAGAGAAQAIAIDRDGTVVTSITLSATAITLSGTVTLNGVALSDYARLSQNANFTGAAVTLSNTDPEWATIESDAATNEKRWRHVAAGGDLIYQTRSDDNSTGVTYLQVSRSGTTVDQIALAATVIALNGVDSSDFARLSQSNTFTGAQNTLRSADAILNFVQTGATANEGKWRLRATSDQFILASYNDADDAAANAIVIDRSGVNISSIVLAASGITLSGSIALAASGGGIRLLGTANNQTTNNSFLSFQQSGGTENGWVGFGSSTSTLNLANSISGAAINIVTTGGGAVTINSSTAITASNLLTNILAVDGPGSGINADFLDGLSSGDFASASHGHAATDLTSGTIPDARFPATLPAASGVNLTALNASNIASGTLNSARLHTTVTSGTYTPTLSNGLNVATSTATVCQYIRIGNVVTVSGTLSGVACMGAGATSILTATLPIASAFADNSELGGAGVHSTAPVMLLANTAGGLAQFTWTAETTNTNVLPFTFTYRII